MALTIRDAAPRKRNIASLVGGIVIALGCFVLWLLVTSELTQWPPSLALVVSGLVVALAVGVWIRLADLQMAGFLAARLLYCASSNGQPLDG